jgi:isopentenyl diphosphate isomerase/L-lactate dehydrogenase-like FMN-dependent dehydrogenase
MGEHMHESPVLPQKFAKLRLHRSARAPIEVLQEIRRERPDLCDKMEIYVDGGIRRGTDVLKALCLGAKAVGIGRPFLYAQSAYGPDGVVKVVESEFDRARATSYIPSKHFFVPLSS